MAKKKADLQSDYENYRDIVAKMRSAHDEARFEDAIALAVSAFEFVDGMMQFERRFEDRIERKSVECIDYVLQYAPLVLDAASLNQVSILLKSQKRVDKYSTDDIAKNLMAAIDLLWQAHRLWDHLERGTELRQNKLRAQLDGDQDTWRWLAEKWEEMGFVCREPENGSYRLRLVTRLEAEVRGKCPSCGVTGKATKERLLHHITCPKCRADVHFVLFSAFID